MSENAKSLIKKMLTYNSKYRISAKQAYHDEWIQTNRVTHSLNVDYMGYLKEFNVFFLFKSYSKKES